MWGCLCTGLWVTGASGRSTQSRGSSPSTSTSPPTLTSPGPSSPTPSFTWARDTGIIPGRKAYEGNIRGGYTISSMERGLCFWPGKGKPQKRNYSGPATKAFFGSFLFSFRIAENEFWQKKIFPTIFGLKEPYLDVILYLSNQTYQPLPPQKNLKWNMFCFRLGTK